MLEWDDMEVVTMRRCLPLVMVLVSLAGLVALADCGCAPQQDAGVPPCFTAVWTCETVLFQLVVPGEYITASGSPLPPLIAGWRIEKMDGTVVFQKLFPDVPLGAWYQMAWDQRDLSGHVVAPDYYRIVVQTSSGGDVTAFVQVVQRPSLFSCTPTCLRSRACVPACGALFLAVERGGSTGCDCSLTLFFSLPCGCH